MLSEPILFPSLSLSLFGIIEQDEPVLGILSSTSDRDKSLLPACSSQYLPPSFSLLLLLSLSLSLSLSLPLPPFPSPPDPSVYFQFLRYIRPRTIQDKAFFFVRPACRFSE